MLRAKREGSYLGQWMKSLEGRAARNVMIVATANNLARISWAVLSEWRELSPNACTCGCQLDEVTLKFVSRKSAEDRKDEKTVKWRAPEPALKYGSFMTVAINKDGHARIIIMRPETILH